MASRSASFFSARLRYSSALPCLVIWLTVLAVASARSFLYTSFAQHRVYMSSRLSHRRQTRWVSAACASPVPKTDIMARRGRERGTSSPLRTADASSLSCSCSVSAPDRMHSASNVAHVVHHPPGWSFSSCATRSSGSEMPKGVQPHHCTGKGCEIRRC